MAVDWTPEQRKVIEVRGRNVLVSAAAGSGKTAVLVERILSMVKDERDPMDIDQLLVVTFTRAAAGEMRERIGRALQQSLEEDPENEHLQRQQTLLHHAQISTIHGFCSYVIRNYFQMIDLDPVYRMADEGEMKLLKTDVVRRVIEEAYASEDPAFHQFVESYASGKTDEGIEELLLKLYDCSMSYPWPEEWLEECRKIYTPVQEGQSETERREAARSRIGQSPWIRYLMEETRKRLESVLEEIRENRRTAGAPDGPWMYDEMLLEDEQQVERLLSAKDFDALVEAFAGLTFPALSRKKDLSVSDALRERVKAERDSCKKTLNAMREQFFRKNCAGIAEELEQCSGPVQVMLRLVQTFSEQLQEQKRSKNMLDFSDLEHYALQILVEKRDGQLVRTEAARELSEQFREIMIDEYQDSNFIQEALLLAVSGEEDDRWNRFMVGDIKQSIYGFRLARPELFLEKYHTYTKEDSERQRIDLHRNFRSRPQVLETANAVFRQVMCSELGGIVYDADASLYPGANFPERSDGDAGKGYETELLLLDREAPELEDDNSRETMMETEASVVAARIRSMVGVEQVLDKESGQYRPVRYRDIVILLRTVSGWADTFSRVLQAAGIPAYTTSKTGYFSANEVVTVLNYLRICDNPRQEIPYTAVLCSPVVGCSDEDLAKIRCADREGKLYEASWRYAGEGEDEALRGRLTAFLEQLEELRSQVPYTPIHELITCLLKVTGYGGYASAMPGGTQRRANLEMLVEKAVEFESTSYRGLFNFIRYIEQLQKYEVDFGEVNIYGESADTVRIMSIHKSKGLEFPVVFLSGTGKPFNQSDSRSTLVLHSSLGIGTDAIDPVRRVKKPTLLKQVIRYAMTMENLAEELRVLYVAMTRPKEKLIITGCVAKLEKKVQECAARAGRKEPLLSYQTITGAGNYLDWILAACSRNQCFWPLYDAYEVSVQADPDWYREELPVTIRIAEPGELVEEELLRQMERKVNEQKIRELKDAPSGDEKLHRLVQERFGYRYPHEKLQELPVKLTVSQLKKEQMEETGTELYPAAIVPVIPRFRRKDGAQQLSGADRGTACHRLLECLDYAHASGVREIRAQLAALVESGKMRQEEADSIYVKSVVSFVKSPVGQRMKEAFLRGTLHREQPFMMEIPARAADPSYPAEEKILVQGMIDAWFPEEDALVLVDYKTDLVSDGTGQQLVQRYRKQLDYYREALERMTGKSVRQRYLYSFSLERVIEVDEQPETEF